MTTTLFSAGLHFGSVIHLAANDANGRDGWPLVIAVAAALVTSVLLFIVKRRSQRELFRQPVLLIVAVICLLVSSVPYFYQSCKLYYNEYV